VTCPLAKDGCQGTRSAMVDDAEQIGQKRVVQDKTWILSQRCFN
jgi:hypothetical protein